MLFVDGGRLSVRELRTGWRLSGRALGLGLGLPITLVLVAVAAHYLAGLDWTTKWMAIDFAAAVALGAIIGRTAIAEGQSVDRRRRSGHHPGCPLRHLRPEELRRCGLTEDEVLAQLRQLGAGSVAELRYVLYETKGELTIVPEPGATTPDPELVRHGLQRAAGYPRPR